MDVSEVKGDVRVEADRVYVIPPSQDIVLADGMLKLVPRGKTRWARTCPSIRSCRRWPKRREARASA